MNFKETNGVELLKDIIERKHRSRFSTKNFNTTYKNVLPTLSETKN